MSLVSKVFNYQSLIREDLSFLQPYQTRVIAGNIRMDANENPFPWPVGMKEELLAQKIAFNRYPDGEARALREAIAAYNRVEAEEVLVGNGSDELIQIILQTFGGRGRALMIHPPTFSMYQAAAAITATSLVEVPLKNGTKLDLEGMLKALADDERIKVIIICNPNNPTGSLFPRQEILSLVQNTEALVIVDEAYFEFAGETLIDVIRDYPNILIMRTFSKAFGMAALRLGYVIGCRELIRDLNRVRQPFNVNSFSQQAGVLALKYLSAYQSQIAILKNEIQALYAELAQIPNIKVLPTRANFMLIQSPAARALSEKLSLAGFTTRYLGNLKGVGESFRLSAALPEENRAFLQAFKEIVYNEE
jgi:histidinol-phosphate aminotransferase